jgi:hypothetical protein
LFFVCQQLRLASKSRRITERRTEGDVQPIMASFEVVSTHLYEITGENCDKFSSKSRPLDRDSNPGSYDTNQERSTAPCANIRYVINATEDRGPGQTRPDKETLDGNCTYAPRNNIVAKAILNVLSDAKTQLLSIKFRD